MDKTKLQQQVSDYLAEGDYQNAIALCQQGINTTPTLLSNYWYLGLAMLLQGEDEQAQAIWLSAITQLDSDRIDTQTAELLQILNTTALRFLSNRNFRQAEIIYWQILELDSEQYEAHYNLGNALSQQGNFDEAINCWQNAIQLKPDYIEVYQEWGKVCQKLEDFENAIACYAKILELKPDSPEIAYNLGLCCCFIGRWEDAIAYFQTAILLKSNYTQAYGDLGYIFLQKRQLEDAVIFFKQAIPESLITSYSNWIHTLNSAKSRQIFFNDNAKFLKALHFQPNSSETFFYLARLINRTNSLAKLAEDVEQKYRSFHQQFISQIDNQSTDIDCQINQIYEPTVEPPQYFYESTFDWSSNYNLSSNYINIYPANTLNLAPPKTPENTIHFSFRFGSQVELPATFVAAIPNGRFWLNQKQDKSAVITEDNQLLGDISPEFPILSPGHPDNHPSKHSILTGYKLPAIHKIDGTLAILSGLLNNTYFHWMFDILPRIELLYKSGIDINSIDKFLVSSRLDFQTETLKILGIPETKILQTDEYSHIAATTLVVPSFPSTIAWMPKWVCEFLQNTFLAQEPIGVEKIERIYISRKDAPNRRIINEDEIINCLSQYGFKSVTLESMSVVEQAALLANAKVVVAPHGGGLTNTVFCQTGTKVIEIFSPNYVYPCYWLISNQVDLEYYYLLGENPEGFYLHKLLYPDARQEDIWVNLDELLNMMRFAGVIE